MPPGDAAAEERALVPGGAGCGASAFQARSCRGTGTRICPLLSSNSDVAGPRGCAGGERAGRATSCPCKHPEARPEARPGVVNRHA